METEFLVESFSSVLVGFVNINNLPSLIGIVFIVTIFVINNNSLTFIVLGRLNIKYLVVGWIDEKFSLVFEHLEPSGVCAPDLHVVGSTSTLDVPRLVVVSGPDGL
jgi:hypothetical protein